MKKLLFCAVLFTLIAAPSFAQLADYISINAWGRAAFLPLWYETPEMQYGVQKPNSAGIYKNGVGVSWDPNNAPRVDFRINGGTNYIGFMVHVNAESTTGVGYGDNGAQIWVKPFGNNWLKAVISNKMIDDTLRGKVGTDAGGLESFVLGSSMMKVQNGMDPGLDSIFYRFAGGAGSNMSTANSSNTSTPISPQSLLPNVIFLSTSPINGLFVGLMLQGMFPDTDLKKTWRLMQLGAGYEIPKVGHLRAQYIGGFTGKEKQGEDFNLTDAAHFEVAFAYTAMQNLLIDVGVKLWMPLENLMGQSVYNGVDVAMGAKYSTGGFNFSAIGEVFSIGSYTGNQMHTPDSDKGANGLHFTFGLVPAWDFTFGTLGLCVISQTQMANTDSTGAQDRASAWARFGTGVWYRRVLDRGSIVIGVTYAFPQIGYGNPPSTMGPDGRPVVTPPETGFTGRGILTIPIIVDYWFF